MDHLCKLLYNAYSGHLKAIYSLGEMNAEGVGVKRNCNYAVEVHTYIHEDYHLANQARLFFVVV